jgi:hypothetical protein
MNITIEQAAPIRACANCEQDHGTLDRKDASKSHGQCRRHFIAFLTGAGISAERAWLEADAMPANSFCPDLGTMIGKGAR